MENEFRQFSNQAEQHITFNSKHFQLQRNLTAWVDDSGRLSLSMGKVLITSRMDIHTDYDIIDTRLECVNVSDTFENNTNNNNLRIVFHYQEYQQFGVFYYYIQLLDITFHYL